MTLTISHDTDLRDAAATLMDDFPQVDAVRVAQAMIRAKIEINLGYQICALDRPGPDQYAAEVTALARQELERATETATRAGTPLCM